tara:strand:+ start:16665 stop:18608 length:1944 start_codon:yes stop_codon:yes gene_type:complete
MKPLFEEPEEDFTPSIDRREPALWIRRLIIVPKRAIDVEPIREIEFRRGLNIIATATPEERVDGVVGHNVGKTLLTRLIRYCLGEQQFAREPVRDAIAKAFPDAFVIAEVIIAGRCWTVRRPIGTVHSSKSGYLEANDWREILADEAEVGRMSEFVGLLDQATVSQFAETSMPHQGRAMKWLDLLAWLSRDQYCRYRHPLQWRTAWTESGTIDLHDEDASVLIRLVMDLLDQDEVKLIGRHKKLLSDLARKRTSVKRSEEQLLRTREFLKSRLKIDDELLTDDMFGDAAKSRAETVKEEIQKTLDELAQKSGLKGIEDELTDKRNSVIRKEQQIMDRQADRQVAEGELKTSQTSSDDSFAAPFADLGHPCKLPIGECPLKGKKEPGQRDPIREMQVQQKTDDIRKLDQLLAELNSQLTDLKLERDKSQQTYDIKAREVRTTRDQLETKLWSNNALIEEAKQFWDSQRTQQTAIENLTKLERQVEVSREAHHVARKQLARKQGLLNTHFNRVLKTLMANEMLGRIEIDMRGLRLELDGRESTPGEAMASETALSLDLACLSASICGLGHFPRFIIHDSPREADLESHIYVRLFEFIVELEQSFGDQPPSFQYIITTTTPPPAELAKEPHLRLTLDARQEDGLLLKERF